MDSNLDPSVLPHDAKGHYVIIAGAITNSLAFAVLIARLYTRYFIINQMGVDDLMAVLSMVATIGMNVSQCINATGSLGRHMYDLNFPVDFPIFLKLFWINEIWYNIAMFFIKMTFLFQYYRVFRQVQAMRITYVVAMVLIGGWCLGQILAVIFACIPIDGFWDKSIDAKCQDQQTGVYLNAVGVLVTDLIILFLPLPSLMKLKLPGSQKVALLGIFSIGIFTSTISIVRLTTLSGGSDFTYDTWSSACWSIAELCSGIMAAALATIRPLVGRVLPALATRASKSGRSYQRYGDGLPTKGSAKPSLNGLSRYGKRDSKPTTAGSETDLVYGLGYEMHDRPHQNDAEGLGHRGGLRGSLEGDKSDSFNFAYEEDSSPTKPQRSFSRRSTQGSYPETPPTAVSTEGMGLRSGIQTKVTGGLDGLSGPRPERPEVRSPRGLAIRVDRDWTVRESTIPPRI
ncbi:hypothetical protein F5Y15DRAFT_51707 [Xylariaceae sp. FL0016]|nr:hypothetical protein F5Y15DRAFT_51707 [Xylariaceae sp. FL0016]